MISRILTGVLALGLIVTAHFAGERAGAYRAGPSDDAELMYLPAGPILRLAAFGHRNFLADLVWLSVIQYYGEQKLSGENYAQAERLFQAIYDLDPHFDGATRFGALVLAQDAGSPEGGIALLDRAARDHPDRWEFPFDRGFIQQTVQK
ncbi:MAG: hypothetical protein HKN12_10310, partial [Gemmatimonadetes bacterium]|nr:hypothetical protein [Gemmatimonadota bacterium]